VRCTCRLITGSPGHAAASIVQEHSEYPGEPSRSLGQGPCSGGSLGSKPNSPPLIDLEMASSPPPILGHGCCRVIGVCKDTRPPCHHCSGHTLPFLAMLCSALLLVFCYFPMFVRSGYLQALRQAPCPLRPNAPKLIPEYALELGKCSSMSQGWGSHELSRPARRNYYA
jgi:hypothetical protein